MKNSYLKNEEIKEKTVLLITQDKKSECSIEDALNQAYEMGVDLVQVGFSDKPVCKLIDYNKFIYDKSKQEKEQKKKQKQNIQELKEIKLSANIADNDIRIKASQASKFLSSNKKVKITLRLRGRESREMGDKVLYAFLSSVSIEYKSDIPVTQEGKIITTVISPVKTK